MTRFTRFIRKVFAAKILLSGKFSLFVTLKGALWGCTIGRVENSKTFQNQMAQCFFIGLYDIETGDDFYFLMGGNGFQKNQFLQGKNG